MLGPSSFGLNNIAVPFWSCTKRHIIAKHFGQLGRVVRNCCAQSQIFSVLWIWSLDLWALTHWLGTLGSENPNLLANLIQKMYWFQSENAAISNENRITIMLIAVVVMFLICQSPTASYLIYYNFYPPVSGRDKNIQSSKQYSLNETIWTCLNRKLVFQF